MNRTIAIGDIHGHLKPLAALIDALAPDVTDTLVFLGDYIDRGPDTRGVIDLILSLRAHCQVVTILGNHEEMQMTSLLGKELLNFWRQFGGIETLASYGIYGIPTRDDLQERIPREHWLFLAACVDFYETDSHIFVHAAYDPVLPCIEQKWDTLRWNRPLDPLLPPHCSEKVVIVGHSPQMAGKIYDGDHIICVDTGCGHGGLLSAYEISTRQLWQATEDGQMVTV